ncbi:hypothetical protein SDC9_164118 [bioreactor metagenome]|uniref:Uncharacterized protein n=1 Tax=bioreactor metagenome TaxID=1076179 RepID=A0A645FT04_9ZZZZ
MRDQRAVARRLDHEMNMRGPPGMAARRPQHIPHRPIRRHGIGHGKNRPEECAPLCVGAKVAARLHGVIRALHVVEPLVVRLPGVHQGVGDGLVVQIGHGDSDV